MRQSRMHDLKRITLTLLFVSVLSACGTQDGDAPPEGTLTISPESRDITVAAGAGCTAAALVVFEYLITTFAPDGLPLGEVDINLTLDFAGNTTVAGPVVTTLIDGDSGDTVSDAGDPLPYSTKTDKSGNKRMFVQFDVSPSCTYTGSLTVQSGSLVADSDFDVSE